MKRVLNKAGKNKKKNTLGPWGQTFFVILKNIFLKKVSEKIFKRKRDAKFLEL